MNEYLSAYTRPSPEKGYVGFVNFSRVVGGVRIIVRPESLDGSGTVELVIPEDAAKNLCMEVAAKLAWGLAEKQP